MQAKVIEENGLITIVLANNTSVNQDINLFDSSDPYSGGVFSPGSIGRVIQYNLSAAGFPYVNAQVVILNFNSNEVPILKITGFSSNQLTYNELLTWLQSLGIGTFTDEGSHIIDSVPNYALADDNGGLYGAILSINNADSFTLWGNGENGSETGSVSSVDSETSNFNINASPVTPGPNMEGNGGNLIPGYSKQTISFNVNAVSDFSAKLIQNNVFIQEFTGGVVGNNLFTFDQITAAPSDNIYVTFLASTIIFSAYTEGVTFSGSGTTYLNDLDNSAYDVSEAISANVKNTNAAVFVNNGNKRVVLTGSTPNNYLINVSKNNNIIFSSNGNAGSVSYTSPAMSLVASDLIVVTIQDSGI
ncbi:MAG: hypothetical protein ACRDE2_00280 [Chitinophagaceae bacterium]